MVYRYFPKLLRAALNNDRKNVEAIALMIGKKLKKEDPEVSAEIMKILSCANVGADVLRSIDMSPVPVDRETRRQLSIHFYHFMPLDAMNMNTKKLDILLLLQ